jgi:hypothetical protein
MKKSLLLFNVWILLLSVPFLVAGQYTGSNPNVAAFKSVLASDSVAGFEPAKAVDTLLTGYCKIPGAAPAWLQIDLGAYHYIDGYAMILPNTGELPTDFTFQASLDGIDWTDLGSQSITTPDTYSYDVSSPDPIRYVRIYMTAKDDPASFTEVYVYGEEILPPPRPLAKEAINVGTTGFLARWFESPTATEYRIDVATTSGFTSYVPGYIHLYVANVLEYNVTGLSPGVTYYYRVYAGNIAGTSDTWNVITVTTAKLPQSITFNVLPATTYGISNFSLTATASSGLPVSYASSDENVATIAGNTVTVVGAGTTSITASQEGNATYNAATPVVRNLLVNLKQLTVTGAIAEDKVYDGTTDAVIAGAVLNGVVGADDVTLSGATTGSFAQSGIGTGIPVSTSMTLAGLDTDNYSFTQPSGFSADITAKELTVSGAAAENKVYDGTSDAVISGASLTGAIGGDDVSLSDATAGSFAQSGVGTGIVVTTSMTLVGVDALNYSLMQPSELAADITARELTVTGATAENKVYDGTTDAVISGASLTGAVDGDDVSLAGGINGTFAQADVGTGIAVTASMSLSGSDAGNYEFDQPSGFTADITAKELIVTADDKSREECASNPEFTISYSGFAGSEDEAVLDAEPVLTCAADENSAPGTYDITVSDGAATNYNLVYVSGMLTVTPDITDPVLAVQNITIQLDGQGSASITAADVVTSASDNCGIADTTLSKSSFTADDVGGNSIDVILSDMAGNTTTASSIVTVQGSAGIVDMDGFEVVFYPNPVYDLLTIETGQFRQLNVKITSLNGEILLNRTLAGENSNQIDLSPLQKGIYFITFGSEDLVSIRKIIKL